MTTLGSPSEYHKWRSFVSAVADGITFNPEKFRFAQDEVKFTGFKITNDTVHPCKRYIRAITDFPTPQSLTDIRSWFGLVNQVSYAFSIRVEGDPMSTPDVQPVCGFEEPLFNCVGP